MPSPAAEMDEPEHERIAESLVVEFVPKSDSQVQRLLASREDIFTEYDKQHFEAEFGKLFEIERSDRLVDCQRTLYLMTRKEGCGE